MRILGIDPGYERVGVAVVEKNNTDKKEILVHSDCLTTDRKISSSERLRVIGEGVRNLIETHTPHALAIETLLFNSNQKTVMLVAAARGVIMYEAARAGIPVLEYSPLQVKIAVAGYGRAEKHQVSSMVEKLIKIPPGKRYDDEYDAIAIALTALASHKLA